MVKHMKELNTILVVEDDKMTRQLLRENLESENFIVIEACKGQRSVDILKHHKVDTVLLDLHLPDADGIDFIPAIRQHTNVPLIIVSGEEETKKKVAGLNDGADDFIAKPIDFDMMIAKINAHIRRHKSPQHHNEPHKPHEHKVNGLSFNRWTVNTSQYQLLDKEGRPANLTFKEFAIVKFLIDNAGKTITRSALCELIKEQNYIPSDRAIDVKIARIRKKIGDDAANPTIIQTVRGAGYVFCASLHPT